MYQNPLHKSENSPFLQMLYLLLFAFGGLIVFVLISFVLVYFFYGIEAVRSLLMSELKYPEAFKIVLMGQQLGLFLTPAILLSIVEGKRLPNFYGMRFPKVNLLILVAILSICWMPLMAFANEWNQKMVFPEFLKGIERWMRETEDLGIKTTEFILKMNNPVTLFVNLLVIAVTPAICEEFIFRGAVQRTIFRIKSNPHLAIWLSAAIFSAIHFQFYGFLPRLLLGAAFGYVYFWTGSIWYAVFAHFLNNAYAVSVAYYLQANNQSYTNAEDMQMPWYGYLISAILTLALFKFLKNTTDRTKERELNSSDFSLKP